MGEHAMMFSKLGFLPEMTKLISCPNQSNNFKPIFIHQLMFNGEKLGLMPA